MEALIKAVIEKEFKSNEIDMKARVNQYAWQFDKVTTYQIILLYSGSRRVLDIFMNAERPYVPKLKPSNPIEPHKMIRLCEIIMEAFKELERLSEQE